MKPIRVLVAKVGLDGHDRGAPFDCFSFARISAHTTDVTMEMFAISVTKHFFKIVGIPEGVDIVFNPTRQGRHFFVSDLRVSFINLG